MSARFDHLVVSVEDLDEAAARWSAPGLSAVRGGAHPVGTENALVRGPEPAYVELIAAESDDSNPWLDRVRSARGPISWAIAVEDIEGARDALVEAGFDPGPAAPGSRRTPDGELVEWRVCDIGPGPYDGSLPFLIEWTTPMAPGPGDGPVIEHISLTPPDPDRVADLLLALGFVPSRHWPRRMLHEPDGPVAITLGPVGEAEDLGTASWSMSWEEPNEPSVAVTLRVPHGELTRHTMDGLAVTTYPDRRRFTGAAILPAVDEAYARAGGQSGDQLGRRADAWVEAIVAADLGVVDTAGTDRTPIGNIEPERVIRLRGRAGTQPLTIACGTHPGFEGTVVVIGVGDPVEVLERHGAWGEGRAAHELGRIDDSFVLALSGGVYVVREGTNIVTRALDGWGSNGLFADGEAERWLAEAADGRRTEGVLAGDPWL